jgi:hypothetical protein
MNNDVQIAPVLLLVFNRPVETLQVFNAIRNAKPAKLYIASDGPRINKNGEVELCQQVKQIISNVDWECDVKTLFRGNNLGCKYAVATAIDWFFENESEGIILEDDTLPSNSFFIFCSLMLEYFREDKRVMRIAGYNPLINSFNYSSDYFFSYFPFMWGWATWKRAWKYNDLEMSNWETVNDLKLNTQYPFNVARNKCFQEAFDGLDTWDYQWDFSMLCQNGLGVVPAKSLIQNIGFNSNATHTMEDIVGFRSKVTYNNLSFPLKGPNGLVIPYHKYEKMLLNQIWVENLLFKFFLFLRLPSRIINYIKKKLFK